MLRRLCSRLRCNSQEHEVLLKEHGLVGPAPENKGHGRPGSSTATGALSSSRGVRSKLILPELASGDVATTLTTAGRGSRAHGHHDVHSGRWKFDLAYVLTIFVAFPLYWIKVIDWRLCPEPGRVDDSDPWLTQPPPQAWTQPWPCNGSQLNKLVFMLSSPTPFLRSLVWPMCYSEFHITSSFYTVFVGGLLMLTMTPRTNYHVASPLRVIWATISRAQLKGVQILIKLLRPQTPWPLTIDASLPLESFGNLFFVVVLTLPVRVQALGAIIDLAEVAAVSLLRRGDWPYSVSPAALLLRHAACALASVCASALMCRGAHATERSSAKRPPPRKKGLDMHVPGQTEAAAATAAAAPAPATPALPTGASGAVPGPAGGADAAWHAAAEERSQLLELCRFLALQRASPSCPLAGAGPSTGPRRRRGSRGGGGGGGGGSSGMTSSGADADAGSSLGAATAAVTYDGALSLTHVYLELPDVEPSDVAAGAAGRVAGAVASLEPGTVALDVALRAGCVEMHLDLVRDAAGAADAAAGASAVHDCSGGGAHAPVPMEQQGLARCILQALGLPPGYDSTVRAQVGIHLLTLTPAAPAGGSGGAWAVLGTRRMQALEVPWVARVDPPAVVAQRQEGEAHPEPSDDGEAAAACTCGGLCHGGAADGAAGGAACPHTAAAAAAAASITTTVTVRMTVHGSAERLVCAHEDEDLEVLALFEGAFLPVSNLRWGPLESPYAAAGAGGNAAAAAAAPGACRAVRLPPSLAVSRRQLQACLVLPLRRSGAVSLVLMRRGTAGQSHPLLLLQPQDAAIAGEVAALQARAHRAAAACATAPAAEPGECECEVGPPTSSVERFVGDLGRWLQYRDFWRREAAAAAEAAGGGQQRLDARAAGRGPWARMGVGRSLVRWLWQRYSRRGGAQGCSFGQALQEANARAPPGSAAATTAAADKQREASWQPRDGRYQVYGSGDGHGNGHANGNGRALPNADFGFTPLATAPTLHRPHTAVPLANGGGLGGGGGPGPWPQPRQPHHQVDHSEHRRLAQDSLPAFGQPAYQNHMLRTRRVLLEFALEQRCVAVAAALLDPTPLPMPLPSPSPAAPLRAVVLPLSPGHPSAAAAAAAAGLESSPTPSGDSRSCGCYLTDLAEASRAASADGLTLLHRAVRSGDTATVDVVLRAAAAAAQPRQDDIGVGQRQQQPPDQCAAASSSSSSAAPPPSPVCAGAAASVARPPPPPAHPRPFAWDTPDVHGITPLHYLAVLEDGGALARHVLRTQPEALALWDLERLEIPSPAAFAAQNGVVIDTEALRWEQEVERGREQGSGRSRGGDAAGGKGSRPLLLAPLLGFPSGAVESSYQRFALDRSGGLPNWLLLLLHMAACTAGLVQALSHPTGSCRRAMLPLVLLHGGSFLLAAACMRPTHMAWSRACRTAAWAMQALALGALVIKTLGLQWQSPGACGGKDAAASSAAAAVDEGARSDLPCGSAALHHGLLALYHALAVAAVPYSHTLLRVLAVQAVEVAACLLLGCVALGGGAAAGSGGRALWVALLGDMLGAAPRAGTGGGLALPWPGDTAAHFARGSLLRGVASSLLFLAADLRARALFMRTHRPQHAKLE